MSSTQSFDNFARSQLGLDEDEDGTSPHPRRHRQWWETHTAIIILIILAMLGAFAATGLSAGYGYTILKKLNECCHDIKASLADIIALLVALKNLVNAFWAQALTWYNDIVAYFGIVIANEETIIDLIEGLSIGGNSWQCTTGYALPGSKCIELTQAMLPLVVPLASSGACYVLQSDLTWTGASDYAINWYGGGGALYGCGHVISASQPTDRIIHVVGDISNPPSFYGNRGELDVYDLTLNGPPNFYNDINRGVFSESGAHTRLFNVKTFNWHYGSFAMSALLDEYNCNHTVVADTTSPDRIDGWLTNTWSGQHTGSRCKASICTYKDSIASYTVVTLPNGTVDYEVISFYDYFSGFWGDYDNDQQATVMTVEGCTATGTEPYWLDNVGRGFLLNSNAQIAPAYPPANPAYPNFGQYSYGVRIGGDIPTNIVVDGLNVDAREISKMSGFAYALWLVGTKGQIIKNVNVFGSMPITQMMNAAYPSIRRNGLITIEPSIATVDFEPVQLINVNVKSDTAETIGLAVNLAANTITHGIFECYGTRSTIRVDGCSFVGGAAGIAIGSEQRHLLSVANSVFEGSYYGIYAFNTSTNLVFKNNDFARLCTAIRLEGGVGNTIVRDNNFVSNNYDLDDVGSAAIEVGSINAGTLFSGCNATAAPQIWDQSLIIPCGTGPASDSVPPPRRDDLSNAV